MSKSEEPFYVIEVPAFAGEAWREVDGEWRKLTDEERAVDYAEAEVRRAAEIKAKGHDCWEHPVHYTFESSRGGQQDAYDCGICGALLQVG